MFETNDVPSVLIGVLIGLGIAGLAFLVGVRVYNTRKSNRREKRKENKTLDTQINISGRITGILMAAARLNPTRLVNPQAMIVVHNLGIIPSGGEGVHQIFVGWKNQYHTLGIVQVLIGQDLKVWSESPSKSAEFITSPRPTEDEVEQFAHNVGEFVRTFNTGDAQNKK